MPRITLRLFDILRHSTSAHEKESAFIEVSSLLTGRHSIARPREAPIGGEKRRVRRIIELSHDRLAEAITLEELASLFDCTPIRPIGAT